MTHEIRATLRSVALSCLLVIGGAGSVAAFQQAPDQSDQAPVLSPGELQRLIDAYAIVQAQQYLGLSDAQFPQFLSRLRALQETRRRNEQARNKLLQELNQMTNPNVALVREEVLRDRLKALQELESRSVAEVQKGYESLDQILDVRQQARFRVLEEQMERRKLELLMRARAAGRARPQRPLNRP